MTIKERMQKNTEIRFWRDTIRLHYNYTAGLAGDTFYKSLMKGKIVGSYCDKCKETALPPRIYCLNCYSRISKYVEINEKGTVLAVARKKDQSYGFISFKNVKGGLIHKISNDVSVGDSVEPVFKNEEQRKGELSDIVYFAKVRSQGHK